MLIAICDELSSRKQSRLFKVMHPFSLLRLTDYGVREIVNLKGSLEEKKNLTIPIEMLNFCIYGREDSSDSECSYESPSDSEIPLEIQREGVLWELRVIAVLMCKHSRLGEASLIKVLSSDLMKAVVDCGTEEDPSTTDCFGRPTYCSSIAKN